MEDKLLKIISHYGVMKQLKYLHTEYFELDEAILKEENKRYFGNTRFNETHIAEEIADVMVMLKQFQYFFGIEDKQIEDIM